MSSLTTHTHTAGEAGLLVNSYIVETEAGAVVVDTNLLNTDIAALVARVGALRRPLAGVFVTHPHPDHFNGVHALLESQGEREVPVYATAAVAQVISEIADAKRAQWSPVYGEEWPKVTACPTVLLGKDESVEIGGVVFSAYDVGPAESHADSYILARASEGGRPTAFIGDLAFDGTHPYTADGHSGRWLAALETLPAELGDAERLLPGHGAPSGIEVLARQREHLLFYRETVRHLADGASSLNEAAKTELERRLRDYAPDARLDWMISLGADAVAAELAAER